MTGFQEKVAKRITSKRSNLSVGLDPALPGQVSKDAVPSKYLAGKAVYEGLLDFCLHVIDQVADSAVAIKITQPYVMGFSDEHHRKLTDRMRERAVLSVYDMKLGAVLRTAFAALWYCHRWGYDAVTLNPYRGDFGETIKAARELKPPLGTLVNVLSTSMGKYVGRARVGSRGVADEIISELKGQRPDGCLFGAGRYVTNDLLRRTRRALGRDSLFLFVLDNDNTEQAKRTLRNAGQATLINVGRGIVYSDDPGKSAEEWVKRLRSFLKGERGI